MNRLGASIVVLVFLLIAGPIGKNLILGTSSVVSLPEDPVASAVTSSLQGNPNNYLPIEGKDFIIGRVQYIDNRQWAVASVAPVGTFADSAVVVLKLSGNNYQVVQGPTSFSGDSDFSGLPVDVVKYLQGQ